MPAALQTSANIPLKQIAVVHNHRKYFDPAKLEELAASVKAHGVLQPVLVRPKGKAYELVFGERRFRAAQLAGLKEIPATIREMDDKTALEVALVENLRRADVLPMEEAEGYQELHQVHKVSVEQLAKQVGKSAEYVYGRLKLCELKSPAVRKALDAGLVSPSTALLVARIPGEKLQEQAAKKILEGGQWSDDTQKFGPMSYRRAQREVEEHYMLQLGKAPFDIKDGKLLPDAGACGPCPKRTGNCAELYPDVKSPNVCTDPACFGKKKAEAFRQEKAAAAAEGKHLLKESKALWDWEGKKLGYKGQEKYVELSDKCESDKKKRTYKELLGKSAPIILARDPNGKMHQLLEKASLQAALEAAGHSVKIKVAQTSTGNRVAESAADRKQQRKERELRDGVVARVAKRVTTAIATGTLKTLPTLRLIALSLESYEVADALRGLGMEWTKDEEISAWMMTASEPQLVQVLFMACGRNGLNNTWDGYEPVVEKACEALGLELKALEAEQRAADAAAPAKENTKASAEDEGDEDLDGEGEGE